jgi:outer membrane protein assembly factor BamA
MLKTLKFTYILLIIIVTAYSCRQAKYVPEGKYLLKKNSIHVEEKNLDLDEVTNIIRQKPNFKTVGFKIRLWAYNRVDSTHVANKRIRKNIKLRVANKKIRIHRDNVNRRRIERSRRKGKELYTEKLVKLKDTISPRMFFREWFKYRIGEKPAVFDSILFNKSLEQLAVFIKNRGFFYGSVAGDVEYKRKAKVTYTIKTGPQYIIDSVYIISSNQTVTDDYTNFVKKEDASLIGLPFDKDYLNDYRSRVAKFMRDNALYGFSSSHMNYIADTIYSTMKVNLGIRFTDRMIRSEFDRDSLVPIKHKETEVRNVYFHISDSTYFKGNFKKTVENMGLTLLDQQFIRTIDTFLYAEMKKKNSEELDPYRIATFLYNGKLEIDPGVIEIQNYLEHDNYYKEYYLERTYTRLMQLGLFKVIKPVLVEIPGTNLIDVHYYLVPSQKKSYSFEPRATTSNGFLGVAASINYTNKNLFGGAQKLIFSLSGGFESQPPVFDETLSGDKIETAGRSFNTFEIGPSLKLDIPGLFPTKVTTLSKRQRPRTIMSAAYNFQSRNDFKRQILQLNYLWKFYVSKTQIFQVGLPGISVVKFVRIENQPDFQAKLDAINDLFLINTYSNQFVWQDWKLTFEYNNKDKDDKKPNFFIYMNSSFDPAGNTLSLFKKNQDTLANGQKAFFGVGYAQFARLDNEIIASNQLGKKSSIHGRLLIGGGLPYGNSRTSMPYDYSFFAGGANDNRGWRARALGPGAYKYYLDTNRTATQIGDLRIGSTVEYRFNMGSLLKGAIFMDAGNVWTIKEDVNRIGGQISNNWYKQIALSSGVGLRLDLDFFIIRLDLGLPITNPALPAGSRWIFQKRDAYYAEGLAVLGVNYKDYLPKPFTPNIHFGIGYPF